MVLKEIYMLYTFYMVDESGSVGHYRFTLRLSAS